eukprot:3584801-Pyramimonas_sp.AAC.1
MNNILGKWHVRQNTQKKDIISCLGSHKSNKRFQESCPSGYGAVRTSARRLGARHHMRGSNATELEFRIRAIHAC